MLKSNKLSKNQFLILRWIAEDGPATEYELSKNLKINRFVAHEIPFILAREGLLKAERKGKSRAGKTIRLYSLTFSGLMKYFAHFASTLEMYVDLQKSEIREGLKKAILKAQQFFASEPIFSEWDSIEKWLGTSSYSLLCRAASVTEKNKLFLPIGYQREDRRYLTSEQIDEFVKEKDIFDFLEPTREEEHTWKLAFENAFVEPFFELILGNPLYNDYVQGKISPVPNKNLHILFQEVLDSKIKEAQDQIKRITIMEKAFEILFKAP